MLRYVATAFYTAYCHTLGGYTNECRSTKASAAVEGGTSGPSYWLCCTGGSSKFKAYIFDFKGLLVKYYVQGFRSDDMRAWRQHWNHQLYKALEHQYQMGLEALNKNLPEIHIDLTFR